MHHTSSRTSSPTEKTSSCDQGVADFHCHSAQNAVANHSDPQRNVSTNDLVKNTGLGFAMRAGAETLARPGKTLWRKNSRAWRNGSGDWRGIGGMLLMSAPSVNPKLSTGTPDANRLPCPTDHRACAELKSRLIFSTPCPTASNPPLSIRR